MDRFYAVLTLRGWFLCLLLIAYTPVAIQAQPAGQGVSIIDSEAVAGEPFGVGHVTIPLGIVPSDTVPRVLIRDKQHRLYYPAFNLRELPPPPPQPTPGPPNGRRIGGGALVQRIRQAVANARTQMENPQALDIDFLFIGSEPLEIVVEGDVHWQGTVVVVDPKTSPSGPNPRQWYLAFTQNAQRDISKGEYPPLFQTFVAETMARRFDFAPIDVRQSEKANSDDPFAKPLSTLELLSSTESLRDEVFRDTIRQPVRVPGEINVTVPAEPAWQAPVVPATPANLPIEELALNVPADSLYLRFGRFSNYLWFREFTSGKGAGLAQMLSTRGFDSATNPKIEKMLNTKMTLIAQLFGDAVIKDMAIIGNDLYLQDGASMGVLFQSSNVARLQSSMDAERAAAAKERKSDGVQLDTLEIAGRKVTLLSNRDHSIRSFRAVDGDYVLLTTSQTLVEKFFAVRDGAPSLGQSPEFRYARLIMPMQNSYELFGYFSTKFLQHLISPQYNIELRRRYAVKARLAAVEMASWMADAENIPHDDLDDLIQSNLLPPWFNESADGSQIVKQGERWADSRRGALGAFLPIADVPLQDCTPQEATVYAKDAAYYSTNWRSTEPILLGIRRFESELGDGLDRLAIEAIVTPFDSEKFGKYGKYLAPPVETIIAAPPDDLVSIQVHMAGQNILGAHAPDNVLFAGLKDAPPPLLKPDPKLLEIWQTARNTPFYLGAWPLPHYLDQLPLGLGGSRPDALGFSRALIGLWRWQGDGFSVISFDRGIIESAIPFLAPIQAPDPAQIRVQVKDLDNTQLAAWVNTYWFRNAVAACRGNLRLLDSMQQQFHLPPEDTLRRTEYLLDGKLTCPLGGTYQLQGNFWNSTYLTSNPVFAQQSVMQVDLDTLAAPPDFRAGWLGWLRSLQAHLTQTPGGLTVIATADVEKLEVPTAAAASATTLPQLNFDLFSLPSQIFGGAKADDTPTKDQREF